jgi:hypothetical protein
MIKIYQHGGKRIYVYNSLPTIYNLKPNNTLYFQMTIPAFYETGWLEFGALQTQEGTTKHQQSVYQNVVSSPNDSTQ